MRHEEKIQLLILVFALLTTQSIAQKSCEWKAQIPKPVFEQNQALVDLYMKAWETAHARVMVQDGLPQSPYMDEACWDSHIWIWDTAFMAFFTKYSPKDFPGVESLKNFYVPMHDGKAELPLRIQHPDNPPIFAWCEYNNWKFNGTTSFGSDKEAVRKTIQYLIKHFEWFNQVEKGQTFGGAATVLGQVKDGQGDIKGYLWNGVASGMDNTTRGRGIGLENALWVDAIAQQGLSALYIARLADAVKDKKTAETYYRIYDKIKNTVNTLYWDDEDGVYYDIHKNSTVDNQQFDKVLTPASFWPLLAEMASPDKAKRMAELLIKEDKLGGAVPVVTVSRDDENFNGKTGDYWRGGIWLPTTYMTVKALEKYGMFQLANDISERTINHMLATYQNPEAHEYYDGKPTIWECYNPNKPLPSTEHGRIARPEFCGWSALGPISLFIENVLGFYEIDASKKIVKWNLRNEGKHGIKQLSFGSVCCDILHDNGVVTIDSNKPFTLYINNDRFKIKAGHNRIELN